MRKKPKPTTEQLGLKPGDKVNVRLDSGEVVVMTVKHEPTKLGGHTWVAWLEEMSSCFALERVTLKIEVQNA